MKKLLLSVLILPVLFCVLTGCSNGSKTVNESVSIGVYVMEESEEPLKPSVSLEEGNRFTFTYSVLSSYIAVGTYEVNGDKLVLKTDDDKYKYVFRVEDGSLIFCAEESSEIPSYAYVPDGAVFK